jgi:hypothetical protein
MRWALALALVAGAACAGGEGGGEDGRATGTTTASPSRPVGSVDCEASEAGAPIELDDVTEQMGLIEPLRGMVGHAAATGDVNGDGWLDLFVGTFTDKEPGVYRQRGASGPAPDRLLLGGEKGFRLDPSFDDGRGRTSGAVFADLDGDGDLDLVVARNVNRRSPAGEDTVVLRNDDGRFEVAGHPVPGLGARGVGVLDHDGDGDLDLFVAEDHYTGGSSVLLRNDGRFRFTDVSAAAGLPDDVAGFSVAAADLSGDGAPDLFIAGTNRLFVNDGKGRYSEADGSVFRWEAFGDEDDVTGVAVGDLNRDSRLDLVLGQHYNSTVDAGRRVPVRVYLQERVADGEPVYRDVTGPAGVPALPTKGPHVEIVDFDNDGWPDILTSASAGEGTRPAILRHLGLRDGVPRFATPDGLGAEQYWVTGTTADFDGDGHLDAFVVDFDPARPSRLFRGATCSGRWIEVEVPAGGAGAGALVAAYEPGQAGDASALVSAQPVALGRGYAAGGPPVAHLGLGALDQVDIVVTPPTGRARTLPGAAAGRRLRYPADFPS